MSNQDQISDRQHLDSFFRFRKLSKGFRCAVFLETGFGGLTQALKEVKASTEDFALVTPSQCYEQLQGKHSQREGAERKVIWVQQADFEETEWSKLFSWLNIQRDRLIREVPVVLVLAGPQQLMKVGQRNGPDFWSISMVNFLKEDLRTRPPQRKQFRALQLAHLCFSHKPGPEHTKRLDVLLKKMKDMVAQGKGPELVLITGNIVKSGKAEEYAIALKWLREMATILNHEPRRQWFVVPGELDVDRDKIALVDSSVLRDIESERDIQLTLENAEAMDLLSRRLQAFYTFTRDLYGLSRAWQPQQPWRADVAMVDDLPVGILQLNSAWAVGGPELFLGREQVRESLSLTPAVPITLALCHHPLETLNSFETASLGKLLRNGSSFLLRCGEAAIPNVGDCREIGLNGFDGVGLTRLHLLDFDLESSTCNLDPLIWEGNAWHAVPGVKVPTLFPIPASGPFSNLHHDFLKRLRSGIQAEAEQIPIESDYLLFRDVYTSMTLELGHQHMIDEEFVAWQLERKAPLRLFVGSELACGTTLLSRYMTRGLSGKHLIPLRITIDDFSDWIQQNPMVPTADFLIEQFHRRFGIHQQVLLSEMEGLIQSGDLFLIFEDHDTTPSPTIMDRFRNLGKAHSSLGICVVSSSRNPENNRLFMDEGYQIGFIAENEKPAQVEDIQATFELNLPEQHKLADGIPGFFRGISGSVEGLSLVGITGLGRIDLPTLFPRLIELDLSGTDFCNWQQLSGLGSLRKLSLKGMKLEHLRPSLGRLESLQELDLSDNQIKDLTLVTNLTSLKSLHVKNNQALDIETLIPLVHRNCLIHTEGTPIEFPPEVIAHGHVAIISWFNEQREIPRPLNEARVILLGEGSAGKTSLMKRLLRREFDPKESQTHGIDVAQMSLGIGKDPMVVRLWDFGGQEIMHATHQLFLSSRSLYILVLDGRRHERPEYWLKLIQVFGGNAPVFVVMNKIDQNQSFDIDRRLLKSNYPFVEEFFRISCKMNWGIRALNAAMKKTLADFETVTTVWPWSWFSLKQRLENESHTFLSKSRFQEMCWESGIYTERDRKVLLRFLHDLGIVLHYKNLKSKNILVSNPDWLTSAIHHILNSEELAKNLGTISFEVISKILSRALKDSYHYPKNTHNSILELMKTFELCYEMDGERILVPDLLPKTQPELEFPIKQALKFRIQYEFLPTSVIARLIIRRSHEIKDGLVWRQGAVFYNKRLESRVLIQADYENRSISGWISGGAVQRYLAILLDEFERINRSFQANRIIEEVACICTVCKDAPEPAFHPLNHLFLFYIDGDRHVRCPLSTQKVSIAYLLGQTFAIEESNLENLLENVSNMRKDQLSKAEQEKLLREVDVHSLGGSMAWVIENLTKIL